MDYNLEITQTQTYTGELLRRKPTRQDGRTARQNDREDWSHANLSPGGQHKVGFNQAQPGRRTERVRPNME